jgi:hypothetical protein
VIGIAGLTLHERRPQSDEVEMRKQRGNCLLAAATALLALAPHVARADPALGPLQLVEVAEEVNPQVRAARARWYSAMHSIRQNYAPADPIFGYVNLDSPTNGFSEASVHTLTVIESLQFPGKALLQADRASRSADIARLTYQSVVRDVRAQTETAYRGHAAGSQDHASCVFG